MFQNHTLYEQKLVKTSLSLVFSYRKHSCCCEIFYSVKYSTLLEDLTSLACKIKKGIFVSFFFLHFLSIIFKVILQLEKPSKNHVIAMEILAKLHYVFSESLATVINYPGVYKRSDLRQRVWEKYAFTFFID